MKQILNACLMSKVLGSRPRQWSIVPQRARTFSFVVEHDADPAHRAGETHRDLKFPHRRMTRRRRRADELVGEGMFAVFDDPARGFAIGKDNVHAKKLVRSSAKLAHDRARAAS